MKMQMFSIADEHYRNLFESHPEPMWVYDLESLRFLAVNNMAVLRYGYSREEFLSMTIKDIRPAEDVPALLANVSAVTEGMNEAGIWRHKRKDGSLLYVQIVSHVVHLNGRKGELVMITDITERVQGEETRSRLQQAIENSHDVVFMTDTDGTIMYVNPEFERLYGYSAKEALGKNPGILQSGKTRPGFYEQFWKTIRSGQTVRGEIINRTKDGRLLDVEITVDPVIDESGVIKGFVSIQRDITDAKAGQAELRRNQQLLSETQRLARLGSWEVDLASGTITWSDELYRIYGVSREAFTPTVESFLRIVHHDDRPAVQQWIGEVTGGTRTPSLDFRIVLPDGLIRFIRGSGEVQRDSEGKPIHVLGAAQDITERKEVESALLESEDRFRRLAENAPDLIYRYEFCPSRGFTYVSPAAIPMTGYTPEEHYADPDLGLKIVHPDDRHLLKQATQSSGSEPLVLRWLRKDGTVLWTEQRNVPVLDADGRLIALEGIARDITDRKRSEEALLESERRFRQITETIQEVFWMTDPEKTQMLYIGSAYEAVWGRTREELYRSPQSWMDAIHPEDRPRVRAAALERQANGEYDEVYRILRPDGSMRWIYDRAYPVKDERGSIVGVTGIAEDITARKLAEEALIETESKFRALAESASSAIFIYGQQFTYANPAAEVLTGYSREELLRMNCWDVVHPDHRDLVRGHEKGRQSGREVPARYEFKILRKDGQERWVDFSAAMFSPRGSASAVGMAIDVTEQKLAEESLRKSEEWHRKFFDDDLTGDFISTPDGTILACNRAFARIFGFPSVEEALKGNAWMFHTSREERMRFLELLKREKRLEYHEIDVQTVDGRKLHLVENVIGIFDDQGELVQIKGYLFDDTRRRELEAKLIETQKMESIGTLAGGIAHDFNNILGIILGHVGVLELSDNNTEKQMKSIEAIAKATQRGAGLVRQILTFARKTEPRLDSMRLNEVVDEVVRLLDETLPKKITMQINLAKKLPSITADQTQIHQAILNLAVNARDAMPSGGTLTFGTSVVRGETLAGKVDNGHAESYVLLTIQDTGSGMSESTRRRIFEPFFTTKEQGKGTGLGLAVVYGIVKAHGGHILVQSAIGKGTTFELYFPVLPALRETTITTDPADGDSPGGDETILLVEDEEMLMDIVTAILRDKGYHVIQAVDGHQAVALFEESSGTIDLVLSDIGLPGLTGAEVFHRMKKINPDVRIILATGYIEAEQKAPLLDHGVKEILAKPYRQAELLRKIRKVLDEGAE